MLIQDVLYIVNLAHIHTSPAFYMKSFRRIHLFIVITLVVFGFFIWTLWQNHQQTIATRDQVNHTNDVINKIYNLYVNAKDAQANTRAYVITGDVNYKSQIETIVAQVKKNLDTIARVTNESPVQKNNLAQLRRYVDLRLQIQADEINNREHFLKENNYSNQVRLGSAIMDSLSASLNNMIKEEELLLRERSKKSQDVSMQGLLINAVAIIFAFTILLVLLLQIDKDDQLRRRYQKRINAFLSSTKEGFYLLDKNFKVEMINKSAQQMLQPVTQKFIEVGDRIIDYVPHTNRANLITMFEKILQGESFEYETKSSNPDVDKYYLITAQPVKNLDNEISGISMVFKDIADIVKNREDLIEAKNKAQNAEKAQEDFLANISHEIRTPVNGITGMANLMTHTKLDDQQKEFLSVIQISAEHLMELINDVLDFSKIKSGKITLEQTPFEIRKKIEETVAVLKMRADQKGIALHYRVSDEVPAFVKGDVNRLNQVLINLLSNGIKFTAKGSVSLAVNKKEETADAITLQFIITDTGIGIRKERQVDIFENFVQAEKETATEFGGTGLGLSISKRLVELQGGTIEVNSELGKGAVFSFTIPYLKEEKQQQSSPATNLSEPFPGKKVLVIEDNVMNQMVIRQYLKNLEVYTEVKNNGKLAVDHLAATSDYDLIILDLRMPEMDGFATAAFIRQQLHLSIPIIAFTASALRSEKEKCLAVGMNEYLTKPFRPAELYELLKKYLSN